MSQHEECTTLPESKVQLRNLKREVILKPYAVAALASQFEGAPAFDEFYGRLRDEEKDEA